MKAITTSMLLGTIAANASRLQDRWNDVSVGRQLGHTQNVESTRPTRTIVTTPEARPYEPKGHKKDFKIRRYTKKMKAKAVKDKKKTDKKCMRQDVILGKFCSEQNGKEECAVWQNAQVSKCELFGNCKVNHRFQTGMCMGQLLRTKQSYWINSDTQVQNNLSVGACFSYQLGKLQTCVTNSRTAIDKALAQVENEDLLLDDFKEFMRGGKGKRGRSESEEEEDPVVIIVKPEVVEPEVIQVKPVVVVEIEIEEPIEPEREEPIEPEIEETTEPEIEEPIEPEREEPIEPEVVEPIEPEVDPETDPTGILKPTKPTGPGKPKNGRKKPKRPSRRRFAFDDFSEDEEEEEGF